MIDENHSITKPEKVSLALVLLVIGVLTLIDIFEDLHEGVSTLHVFVEVLIILMALSGSLFLLQHAFRKRRGLILNARKEIASAKEEATSWHNRADSLSAGVTDAILAQFEQWRLTEAERDIAFFLLKGLTIHEIAEMREVTERTIRQQASDIYKKSGLSGRAQLSAFFLEDLFDTS